MSYNLRLSLITALLIFAPAVFVPTAWGDDSPVFATIEASLATEGDQIRQLAFDGDADTMFVSAGNVGQDDHFTLALDKPVKLRSLTVTTGRADGSDGLKSGTVQVSDDGQAFERLASFAEGVAESKDSQRQVLAIRIAPGADSPHPLVIRELTLDSEPPVAIFQYPVEFIVDVSDAPEMKEWAEKAAATCQRAYPMINEELKADGYKPPRLVAMDLKSDYQGVAATGGNHIVGSVKFFKEHPDDVGAMVHETAHVVQNYRGRRNPGWLVEGVADYVRFFKFEPGNLGLIDARRAHYDGSYRVSAAFLAFLVEKYDKEIVRKLNQLLRAGEYREGTFKELTGKSLDELDDEWRATLSPANREQPAKSM
ncbi:MAG TPA: basic secretory protein-like protein [Pirellulales bacterium]|nr:basic secretory protein-like protein [Pirellulales bacterium]